jgi:hypothetical protein
VIRKNKISFEIAKRVCPPSIVLKETIFKKEQMKNLVISLLLFIALVSCEKDKEEEISLIGKWNIESTIIKEYESGVLKNTETEPGDGTTMDFQANGYLKIASPGDPIETVLYSIKPESKVEIDGDLLEIRNLTSTTVTLFFRQDYGGGDYDEAILNLKR